MKDVVDRLSELADRGQPRGSLPVFDGARSAGVQRLQPIVDAKSRRGRSSKIGAALGVLVLLISLALGLSTLIGPNSSRRQAATTVETVNTHGIRNRLAWVDSTGLTFAKRVGHEYVGVPVANSCANCQPIRVGNTLITFSATGLYAVDLNQGSPRLLGYGQSAALAPDGQTLYVRISETRVEQWDITGRRLGGPWMLPADYGFSVPPRAVQGGLLVQETNQAEPSLAVWDPVNGAIKEVGRAWQLIDAITRAGRSIVAWVPFDCPANRCPLIVSDLETHEATEISAPSGTGGFLGGGAFSPDGTELTAFADTQVGTNDPRAVLTLIDLASAEVEPLAGSSVPLGEPHGFAAWGSDGAWVYFGGLSGTLLAHIRGTHDAAPIPSVPASYSLITLPDPLSLSAK